MQGSAGEQAAAQRDEDGGVSGPHGSVQAPGPEPADHHERTTETRTERERQSECKRREEREKDS